MGDDPEVLSRYAWALVRGGQSSRAITVLEEARKRGIAGAEITALLARAYKDQWRERTTKGKYHPPRKRVFAAQPKSIQTGSRCTLTTTILGSMPCSCSTFLVTRARLRIATRCCHR